MHRFLVPTEILQEDAPTLPPDAARHLKVVRAKAGETVELFDGKGGLRTCRVNGLSAPLTAEGPVRRIPHAATALTLFACVTKGSRWDWTIEKAVELGAARIVPVISDRCIVRLAPDERAAKAERWRRIAEDAARQSDAAWLPEVAEPVSFAASLEIVKACGRVFVGALTNPPPPPILRAVSETLLKGQTAIGVYVGPEGDFTPEELQTLLTLATPVSFGPTVLRAETAAVFGLSVLAAVLSAPLPECPRGDVLTVSAP